MLVGYVSDECFSALPGAVLEFASSTDSWEATSRATGAVYCDLPEGDYEVAIQKQGYGAKRIGMTVTSGKPYQFRLLSDGLLGYAWPKWVRSGEEAEFRVHSVEAYHLELWRHGWKKELVEDLGWYDDHAPRATMQITPDGDYTQSGAQWNKSGYASLTHRQFVAGPHRSGLYYFYTRTASGREFSFPWIVAPSQPTAKIAVLAPNITWNAYNNFGGRSNYILSDQLTPTPTVNARLELKRYQDENHRVWGADHYDPLSFDRPEPYNHVLLAEEAIDPIEGRVACHLAPADWRLLAWLERESFDYDLYADTQLHAGQLNLTDYRVLVLSSHPEYWTKEMVSRVKRWVHLEGGQLVYLGGNGVNCAVEIADDDTMTVLNGSIKSLWPEGIGAESRLALQMESEAKLLGVVFDPKGIMSAAPYRVINASHWALAGTGLQAEQSFGTESLHMRCPGGASGHETDKISSSSPANITLLAKGLNADNGGAEMTIYDSPGGGRVFSVGSICYVSSLLVDESVSRITANVLNRFLE